MKTLAPAILVAMWTASAATAAPPEPPNHCAEGAAYKEERDAGFGKPSRACVVTAPGKDDCDKVREGQAFRWKFKNACNAVLHKVRVVDPRGQDLLNCTTLDTLDKNGVIRCDVKDSNSTRQVRYHIVWKETADGVDQVHDPILDVRKNP